MDKLRMVHAPQNLPQAKFKLGQYVRVIDGPASGTIGAIVNMSAIDESTIEYELHTAFYLVYQDELEAL